MGEPHKITMGQKLLRNYIYSALLLITRISTLGTRKSSGLKLFCFVFKFSNIFKFESLLKFYEVKGKYNLYYKVRYVFVCGHYNVPTLTSPSVFKLLDSQGYVWLPYDLTEVLNKANWRNI